MRTGFIGAGNMAQAIIKGMLAGGFAQAGDILASDKERDKLAAFCGVAGIRACATNEEVVAGADAIVLAVKPQHFAGVLPPLRSILRERKPLIISIAAGVSLEKIETLLDHAGDLAAIRVMPNVNAQIGASMSALCGNAAASEERLAWAESLFATLGRTVRIEEELFSAFSAVACASPAFTFMFIEGLARGGLKEGMTRQQAVMAAAQAVMGSARLVLESGQHPCALVDTVCSPGGTTIAGVAALEDGKLIATAMKAVEAATNRDKEMLGKK